ncbi:MAG: four-carbon acid sugar kinase family protein [Anaerolineae bacterium]
MGRSFISRQKLLDSLPPEWPTDLLPEIRKLVRESRRKVVVLDDDPTGTQTVHNIPVLTEWSIEALCTELESELPAFYILTNSRSLSHAEAVALNTAIGCNLLEARRRSGREFVVISRSDSTLRGHFPGEVEALAQALQQEFNAWLIIPFFLEGGRYTIHDVHYVAEGEQLVPAGETEFARDVVFGYRASNLREWVEEKTRGDVRASDVVSISIEDLRLGGPDRVVERLAALRNGNICVVNAASIRDLQVFVLGLLRAEALGKRFLYRTAASFVQVRAGLAPRPLLQRSDFDLSLGRGGLIVVGSYVPRTTAQIQSLLTRSDICSLEVAVEILLDDKHWQQETKRLARQTDQLLGSGCNVMLYTSRQLVTGENAEHSLNIGKRVSEGLVSIVRAISTRPRYLVAKGGITSSDVATYGLDVKRAMVMGQILPGVPVWQLGPESRFPGLVYVVFPGNVGDAQSLLRVVQILGEDEM